ncbi:hypothetical protein ACH5RR_040598 [Cinchona calisaya]|uniref:Aldose 1-epimerase n=1 Tax=Cinchona calisaya TaxID=153742 RepID=A0ABD2XTA7_9GENT
MSALTFLFSLIVTVVGLVNGAATKNDQVEFYVIKQQNLEVTFSNFGARIVSLKFPDKNGKPTDIVLGYDNVEELKADKFDFNAIVGRVANRIGHNQFNSNRTHYKILPNDGKTILNGGKKGFGNVLWNLIELKNTERFSEITFTHKSVNGEEGFPGDLHIEVKYKVISYAINTTITAHSVNKATPIDIAQNLVFNLAGHNSGNILQHDLQINSNKIVELNKDLIPTGNLKIVNNTSYDFLHRQSIGNNLKKEPEGYDINYVLPPRVGLATVAHSNVSGITLAFYTTAQTVHFWTTNEVKNVRGKGGVIYQPHAGFSLVGEGYPDAVNHPEFPSEIYSKGKVFSRRNLYTFALRDWR